VIIGSGPAGYTAAIYSSRAMLHPIMIAGYNSGGQLMLTSEIENFPGYSEAVSGQDLMLSLSNQAKKFGTQILQMDCLKANLSTRPFELLTSSGVIRSKSVIISTGANALWLNAKNEEFYKGKGISTCATCDGFFFRNKSVVVVGGGDSAMEEASFLTRFASDVTLIHRKDSFKASKVFFFVFTFFMSCSIIINLFIFVTNKNKKLSNTINYLFTFTFFFIIDNVASSEFEFKNKI
jgi:thioredoxin reductase (NADPH)